MKHILTLLMVLPFTIFAQEEVAYDLFGSGIKAFYEENHQEAIDFFSSSIEKKNDFSLAFYHRGLAYSKLNKLNEALLDYSKTIELDSTFYDAYFNKGDLLIKLKEFELSAVYLQKLVSFQPQDIKAHKLLGLVYYYLRKYNLANDAYDFVLKTEPNQSDIWYQKGLVNFYNEQYEVAIESFSNAFANNNNYLAAIDMRGLSYHLFNENEKACKDWKFVLEKGFAVSEENFKKYCE